MKTKLLLICAALSAAGTAGWAADQPADASQGRVQVNFDHPENFTDANDMSGPKDATNSRYLPEIRDYIQSKATRYLPDGQKLTVTFTDIDLAGEYEPWRGPRAQDVRIIKDIYIPRLKFDYRVTDSAGNVVKAGHANLTDLNFQQDLGTFAVNTDDPLRYEKRLLDDWMRKELKPAKK